MLIKFKQNNLIFQEVVEKKCGDLRVSPPISNSNQHHIKNEFLVISKKSPILGREKHAFFQTEEYTRFAENEISLVEIRICLPPECATFAENTFYSIAN